MFSALLSNTIRIIDLITEFTGKLIGWCTLAMVLLTFLTVLLRYGFNFGSIAMQESVLYFHGLVFMLGAGYTLKQGGHVRVDIFYQRFSQRKKAVVDLLGSLFLLLPVCIFVFLISFDYVARSWRILESSSEAGGLPLVYISKSLLLVFAVTLALQGVSEIARNIQYLASSSSNASPSSTPEGSE